MYVASHSLTHLMHLDDVGVLQGGQALDLNVGPLGSPQAVDLGLPQELQSHSFRCQLVLSNAHLAEASPAQKLAHLVSADHRRYALSGSILPTVVAAIIIVVVRDGDEVLVNGEEQNVVVLDHHAVVDFIACTMTISARKQRKEHHQLPQTTLGSTLHPARQWRER